jgi:hypothetical protein
MGAAVFIQKGDEVRLTATLVIVDWALVLALGEKFDCGVRADTVFFRNGLVFLRICIEICNDALFACEMKGRRE